jgi:hypothetical protein
MTYSGHPDSYRGIPPWVNDCVITCPDRQARNFMKNEKSHKDILPCGFFHIKQ